jgi:enoyl-CoA hydratase/carnithine racemase
LLTAHRFIASEALASGIVDEVVPASGSEATIALDLRVEYAMSEVGQRMRRLESEHGGCTYTALGERNESPTAGMPQRENAKAFEALLAAEVAAKL